MICDRTILIEEDGIQVLVYLQANIDKERKFSVDIEIIVGMDEQMDTVLMGDED